MHKNLRGSNLNTVYRIKFPNGKLYVGFTEVGILERKKTHYMASAKRKTPIHMAIQKYKGQEEWEVINCYSCKETALFMESFFIKKYNSMDNGYNVQSGGQFVPESRNKKGIPIIDCRGNYFKTYTDCAKFYEVTLACIRFCCKYNYRVKRKYSVKIYEEGDIRCKPYDKKEQYIRCLDNERLYRSAREAAKDLNLTEKNNNV